MEKKYQHFLNALEVRFQEKKINSPQGLGLNFRSQDILGLGQHPYLKKKSMKYVLEWGTKCSRESHIETEEKFAELIGKESILFFSSPTLARRSLLSAIGGPHTLFFIDQGCKKNLLQAAMDSCSRVIHYEHQNLDDLNLLLSQHQNISCFAKIIISESLFEHSGESCDLNLLSEIANKHDALIVIDDSHAIGVMGKQGMGLAAMRSGIDIAMGSLGYACGSSGAYIGLSKLMREYLTSFGAAVEDAPLPPAALGAISAALELIPDMQVERKQIFDHSQRLRYELDRIGIKNGKGESHIIPLLFATEEQLLQAIDALAAASIQLDTAFQPKLIVNALHTEQQLLTLVRTLKSLVSLNATALF